MFRLSFLILTTTTALLAIAAATTEASAAAEQGEVLLHFLAPHPLAGLPVNSDTVTADMLGHYGKPPDACEGDEKAFQISGVPGMVCAPTCTAAGGCPTDLPDGVTARPQCALENRSTGDKYCVLICNAADADADADAADANLRGNNNNHVNGGDRLTDGACGDATCQMVQAGLGICTYDV